MKGEEEEAELIRKSELIQNSILRKFHECATICFLRSKQESKDFDYLD